MDGMLMEWEKMLPDPEEIDDLDQSDLIDDDLPIFDEKNVSPGVMETACVEDSRNSFSDNNKQEQDKKTFSNTEQNEKLNEQEVSTSFEMEESALTLKLIAELNADNNANDVVTKKVSLDRQPYTNAISEMKTPTNSTHDFEKSDEEKVISSYSVRQNSNNESKNQTMDSSGNQIPDRNLDKKLMNDFENCADSPLQISNVRTGDIPSEKDEDCNATDYAEACSEEGRHTEDNELNMQINDVRTEDVSVENNQLVTQSDELGNGLYTGPDVNDAYMEDKAGSANEKNGLVDKQGNKLGLIHNNIQEQTSGVATLFKINEILGDGNDRHSEHHMSPKPDKMYPFDNKSFKQQMGTADMENNIIMMTIKEEPIDYEEYGKPQEIMSNFYSDMDRTFNQAGENPCHSEFTQTENGRRPKTDFTMTGEGQYMCQFCSTRLPNYTSFQNHLNERHKTLYQCKYCDSSFYRSQELAIHCRKFHASEKEAKDQSLKRKYGDEKVIIKKKKKATVYYDNDGNQIYKCAYCGKKFRVQQAMASHVRNCHHNNFNTKEKVAKALTIHQQKSLDKKPMQASDRDNDENFILNKRIMVRKNKANVYYDSDGKRVYKCGYCGRKFKVQQAMASHVKCHFNFNGKGKIKKSVKVRDKIIEEDLPQSNVLENNETSDVEIEKDDKDNENLMSDQELDDETKMKSKSREFSKRVMPYRNMSFETDSTQIEESLSNTDCSLKRELKSNQIYHCSKCTKWFYREKQVLNHEKTCTGIKQEVFEKIEGEMHDGTQTKASSRQEVLKNIQIKHDVEQKIQLEITRKLKEKMIANKLKPAPVICKTEDDKSQVSRSKTKTSDSRNKLPKYFCKYCPSAQENGTTMNLHLVKHLGEVVRFGDKYKCRICKRYFSKSNMVLFHLQSHTTFNVRNLYKLPALPECYICGQPFLNSQFLQKHQRKHDTLNTAALKSDIPLTKKKNLDTSLQTDLATDVNAAIKITSSSVSGAKCGNSADANDISFQTAQTEPKRSVTLDDIPFQCGMCMSRFPNSQFLLHHITLHMQGPYVFKIEVDKKDKEAGNEAEKQKMFVPSGNFSVQKQSFTLPNVNTLQSNNLSNSTLIVANDTMKNLGNLKSVDLSNLSDMTNIKSIDLNQMHSAGWMKQAPLVLNLKDLKKCASGKNVLISLPDTQAENKHSSSMDSIVQDHMYSNLIPPSSQNGGSDFKNGRNNSNSDTESAVTSDDESSAYYDTDECEKLEKEANSSTKPRRVSRTFSTEKKNAQVSNTRVPNFKKTLDIAGGEWFECPLCLHLSITPKELEQHMQNHVQAKSLVTCYVCKRNFLSKWHLSRHMEHNHRQNSYKCSFCDEGFLTSLQVMEHVQAVHH